MKKIIIAALIYISLAVVVITAVLYIESGAKGERPSLIKNPLNNDSNAQENLLNKLKKEAVENQLTGKDLGNIAEYNKCLSVMGEFFESLEFGEYENAYAMLSEEYKAYKELDTIDKFKEYADSNDFANTSADLQSYTKEVIGKTIQYSCDAILYERKVGENISNNEQFEEYLASRPVRRENIILTSDDSDTFRISFEGLLGKRDLDGTLINDEAGIDMSIIGDYRFTDKRVFEIRAKSNYSKDTIINMAEIFYSIAAEDALGNVYWADRIDSSIENEIRSGQEINLMINLNTGPLEIKKLYFKLNKEYSDKSIEMEF